jgi:hypothetical protein
MTANVEVTRQAAARGAVISRGPGVPLQPQPESRQRDAILIVIVLAAAANLAPVALFAIVLAAIRGLVRDSQVIPHALTWFFGPAPAWHVRRRNRRYLRQQMLDAPARLWTCMPAGNSIAAAARPAPGRAPHCGSRR